MGHVAPALRTAPCRAQARRYEPNTGVWFAPVRSRISGSTNRLSRLQSLAGTGSAEISANLPDLILVEAAAVVPGPLSGRFPRGSGLVKVDSNDHTFHLLTTHFFAAADPQISFDGARVLFSGKQTLSSPWQVWEMSTDGTGVRQITHCLADCFKPDYLPRDEIAFTAIGPLDHQNSLTRLAPAAADASSNHSPVRGQEGGAASCSLSAAQVAGGKGEPSEPAGHFRSRPASQLWVCKADGSNPHAITFGPGDYELETILKQGTIVASARWPLLPANGRPTERQLYTLRPDGTGLATLRCDHQHPVMRSQAREVDSGAVTFIKKSVSSRSLGGTLAWIRRGALQEEPLTGPAVLSAQPLTGDRLLVVRSLPSGDQAMTRLEEFDASSGQFVRTIYQDSKRSIVQAVPIEGHEPPRWYRSTLNPDLQKGYFVCLNAQQAQGLPGGKIASKPKRVRVTALSGGRGPDTLLGEAPIEDDGSFYIAIPADRPVRFEVLDAAGRVVRAQRSWIWSRSGEEHGCVGCHEDRALAPDNRWPLALRRFDTPTPLGVATPPPSAR